MYRENFGLQVISREKIERFRIGGFSPGEWTDARGLSRGGFDILREIG